MKKVFILLSLLLIGGCGHGVYFRLPWSSDPPITVHAITPSHILEVPPGATIEWPDMTDIVGPDGKVIKDFPGDLYHVEHWGNYISNFIQTEVMNAKVR